MTARPATPAERAQVRAAARFVAPRIAAGENWLVILACVSRRFSGISLRSALAAYVFNRLLMAEEEPPRPLLNGTGPRMTAATVRANHATSAPSPLAVFIARAEASASLWQAGELDLHEAVDELQTAAVASGLVAKLGQDEVQRLMAEAFRKVREDARS